MIDSGDDCPILIARCGVTDDWTLERFADQCEVFVAEFVGLHPMFADMRLCGKSAKDSPPLRHDRSNLRPWILERSWSRTASPYSERDASGRPTLRSKGSVGFSLTLTNATSWDDKVDWSIGGIGSGTVSATANLVLGRKNHPEFTSGPLPMQLMDFMVRHWPVEHTGFALRKWNERVNRWQPIEDLKGQIEAGWLTYVADASVVKWLPAWIDPQPMGPGVVFQLTPTMSRYDDESHVERGLELKAALDASGLYPMRKRAPEAGPPTGQRTSNPDDRGRTAPG